MTKIYALITATLLLTSLSAQDYNITPNDTVEQTIVVGSYTDATINMDHDNSTTDSLRLQWEIIENTIPTGWDYSICDYTNCYAGNITSGTMSKFGVNQSGFIKINLLASTGIMTLLTFANVVARYVFNSNIFWALELTVFLFAWLVLLGATYAVKKTSHLGVDAIINTLGSKKRKILALFAAFICIFYAFLMLKGSWDYWAPYANLPTTEGRWFPIGFDFTVRYGL